MDALASWRWCLQAERLQDGNAALHTAIADLLWLQTQQIVELRNEIEHEHNDSPPSPSPVNPGPIDDEPPPKPKPSPKPIDPTPHPTPKPNHLRPPEADDAWRLRTASASPLPEARALAKHMRRLRKPILNLRVLKLDEAASIEASVCAGRRWPVLGYGRERWLSLDLLIEQNTSMAIWQDSLRAFEKLCQRVGAFRDVRLWYLDPGTRSISTRDGAPARPLRLLKQSQGRSLIWFAGNLAHSAWHQPDLLADLSMLARQQIVAVLQLLPERLWERSKLARLPQSQWCYFGSRQAGSPNQRYIAEPQDAWPLAPERATTLKLPMLSFEPVLMQAYTNFLRTPSATLMPGLWIDRSGIPETSQNNAMDATAQPAINIKPPEDEVLRRLQQFKRHASAGAKDLLQLLWAMPLWLPLIRLVQRRLLPNTGNAELAEVLHSGLLFRINKTDQSKEELRFNFFDPVRQALKADSTLHDTLDVKHLISVELTRRFGSDVLIGAQSGEDDFATFAEIGELLRSRLYAHSAKTDFSVVDPPVVVTVTASVAPGLISLPAYSISEGSGSSIALPFHISGGAGQITCKVMGAGFSVSPNPLSLLVGVPIVLTVKHASAVAGTFTGQLVCTPIAPAVGGPFVYDLAVVVNPVSATPNRPLEEKQILWVDDSPTNNTLQLAHLESRGALVATVTTTKHALGLLRSSTFDAVISDFGRKDEELAGLNLLDYLDEHGPHLPTAIYSRVGPKFEAEAKNFGAIACTNNFEEVIASLESAFRTNKHLTQRPIWARQSAETLSLYEVMSPQELPLLAEIPGKSSALDTWLRALMQSSEGLKLGPPSRFFAFLTGVPWLQFKYGAASIEQRVGRMGPQEKGRWLTLSAAPPNDNWQSTTVRLDLEITGALYFTSRQKRWLERALTTIMLGDFGQANSIKSALVKPVTHPGKLVLPSYRAGAESRCSTALNFNVTVANCSMDFAITGEGFAVAPTPLNLVLGALGGVVVSFEGAHVGEFQGNLICTPIAPAKGGPFVYELAVTVLAARAQALGPLNGKHVLWVDNNFDKKASEVAQLNELRVAVHHVTTTSEALEAISLNGFDAVISDLRRKGEKLAGLTLVNALDSKFPAIPVAIYSMSAKPFENQARQFGAITCTNNFDDVLEAFAIHYLTNSYSRSKRIWPRAALQRMQVALNLSMDSNELDAITFKEILARSRAKNQSERLQLIDQVLQALLDRKVVHAIVVPTPAPNSTLITKGNIVSRPNSDGYVCISVIRENGALLLSDRQNDWVYEALGEVVKTGEVQLSEQSPIASWFTARTLTDQEFVEACWRMFAVAYSKIDFFNAPKINLLSGWARTRAMVAIGLKARFAISDEVAGPMSAAERVIAFASYASTYPGQNADAAKFFEPLSSEQVQLLLSALESEMATDWIEPYGYCHIDPKTTSYSMKVILESLGIGTVEIRMPHMVLEGDEAQPPYGNLVVSEFGLIYNMPLFLVCSEDDVPEVAEQAATIRVSQLHPRSYKDIESTISELTLQLHDLRHPIFIQLFPPISTQWFEKMETVLHMHRVVLVNASTSSNVPGFLSLDVNVFAHSLQESMWAGTRSESVATLVLDSLYAQLDSQYDFTRKNVFLFGEASLENDLAEFARELRDIVEAKTYLTDPQDTHKNKFGRYPTRNRRALSASVTPLPFLEGEYLVTLRVKGEEHWTLTGEVIFHLDLSFAGRDLIPPTIKQVAHNNSASIQLTAWGAFTVGVLCDENLTNLELDLASLSDAPDEFLAAEVAPAASALRVSDLMVAIDRKNWRIHLRGKPEILAALTACETFVINKVDEQVEALIKRKFQCKASGAISDNSLIIQLDAANFDRTVALINLENLVQTIAPSVLPTPLNADILVFISHAAHDREMALQIERGLALQGIQTFMFTGDVQSGEQIMEMINSALARSTHFLCLLTPTSIGREFVRRELNAATHRQIQGKLKMILVAADGFNAKEHLHDQFPVLANFPLLDFLTADVTVPLLAAEILREPSESKLIEADSAAIEANQHGLSKTAFAIVSHFCRDSDDGIESRTVATEFNELRRLTDSDQAEMEAAIVELKGDIRDLRGSARRALSACPTLFARYDHLFHDWWSELDAVQIGTYLVGEPNIYHSVEQLSQKLSLPPRRVNPAAQWLMMHNLCLSADAPPASNFLNKRLRANGSTREFLREYGERV